MHKVDKMALEIAFVIIVVPTLVAGLLIFSTNDFSFLDGLYLWEWITKWEQLKKYHLNLFMYIGLI